MPHMASVSVGFWVAVGGRHERPEENGIGHFIEHMLFKGTRRRSARQISEDIEGVGGYLNAFTSEEHTCYYARAPRRHLDRMIDVLADMFLNPRFDPVEVEKERGVIKEEIAMYLDQPHQLVQELLNAALWPEHPLGRPLTGTPEGLDRLGREQLRAYHRSHYTAAQLVVTVAGGVEEREVRRACDALWRRLPAGSQTACVPAPPADQEPRFRLVTRQVEQAQLAVGFRTCAHDDPRRFALRILNAIVGENMSSRLFVRLREDLGLAYAVHSSTSFFRDTGDLAIFCGLDPANLTRAFRLVLEELKRLASRAPGRAEFERAREYALGQVDLGIEGTENCMNWLGEQFLAHGRLRSPLTLKQRLARVTPAEVRRVAADFFRPERLAVAVVGPVKSLGRLRRWVGELT
ncbi:MAG: insulinase family protein [Verrucomicrobia bacterium]|nr:MAG: insulinase family protein [Verrucomicrobiota bacterium]